MVNYFDMLICYLNNLIPFMITSKDVPTSARTAIHKFVLKDGNKVGNLFDLASAMENMHQETYSFHANEQKNDFSSWIKDVYGEPQIAENVAKAQNRTQAQLEILKALMSRVKR